MRRWTVLVGSLGVLAAATPACGARVVRGEGTGGGAAGGGAAAIDRSSTRVTIDTSGYPRACDGAGDCVGVFSGKLVCGECSCPNVAIQVVDEQRYRTAFEDAVRATCGELPPAVCHCPNIGAPSCKSGVCTY